MREAVAVTRRMQTVGEPDEESEFFIDNLLVRVHRIDWMTWLTGLAPWEF